MSKEEDNKENEKEEEKGWGWEMMIRMDEYEKED